MSDRVRHITVTLDKDYRTDDVESILSAIEHVRGVAKVQYLVVTLPERLARAAVESDIRVRLHEVIEQVFTQPEGK